MTDHLVVVIYAIFNLWELEVSLENWTIFWWRQFRSRWRHQSPVFNRSQNLELIFQLKNSSQNMDQKTACWISDRIFQILVALITKIPSENPPTKPRFPISRQRWSDVNPFIILKVIINPYLFILNSILNWEGKFMLIVTC